MSAALGAVASGDAPQWPGGLVWHLFVRRNHYETLGLSPYSSHSQIKERFYALSLKYHPDRITTEDSREAITAKYVEITKAYHVLRDPVTKKSYDAATFPSQATRRPGASSRPGSPESESHGSHSDDTNRDRPWRASAQWPGTSDEAHFRSFYGSARSPGRRRSNMTVLIGVLLLGVLGASIQVARSLWVTDMVREAADNRDRVVTSNLRAARERAHRNGFEKQLEVLRTRAAELDPPQAAPSTTTTATTTATTTNPEARK